MTLTIHEHPFASYCWKALIALDELGLPFERVFVGGEEDRARLAEHWPMGGIPVLVDDDADLTLPE
ncbi:MAG: glutathione S-transferase family protein, partial [Solirubrobacterales bacterium]